MAIVALQRFAYDYHRQPSAFGDLEIMEKTSTLALIASIILCSTAVVSVRAQEESPTPAASVAEKPAKATDSDKESWNAARKKASADPEVKAAMIAAKKAQQEMQKLQWKKMREIDPSLSTRIDQEEAKMKAMEAKSEKAEKPEKAGKPAKAESPAKTAKKPKAK